tara:strand:+ start:4781 stop:5287 length:507 start_codon:yes stop_codon:yes gene_type:complete
MADEAKIFMSVKILPDSIKKHLTGLSVTVPPATANEKWYYKDTIVSTTSTDLIAGNFLGPNTGTAIGSSPAAIATGDKVRFLFIKNTGTTDGSTSTTEAVTICFDGGTAAYNLVDGIEIGPGEVFYCKCPNTTVANLHAVTVDTNMNDGGSAGDAAVLCAVAALIDDV